MNRYFLAVIFIAGNLFSAIFTDTFENGVSVNSDSETGFWREDFSPSGFYRNVTESEGNITLSAGQESATATSYASVQSSVDSRFNFLPTGMTFQSAVTVTNHSPLSASAISMRFMISTLTGTLNGNTDAIYLTWAANNSGKLYLKNGGSLITLKSFSLSDTITSFSLTLNSNSYDLTLHTTGTNYNASGTYALAGDWSSGAALTLMAITGVGPGRGDVTFDNVSVFIPAKLSLVALTR